MEPIIAILLFALPFLLYFMFKKIFIKYFTWVYNKTDVNPISVPRQLLGFSFYLPIFIGCFDEDLFFNPLVSIGIPALVFVVLLIINLPMKSIGAIILSTVVQVLFGVLFIARLFVWLCLVIGSLVGSVMYGSGSRITYNPFYLTKLEKNGSTRENSYNPDAQGIDNSGNGIMNNLNRFTDPIERSRNETARNQLEKELSEIQERKREDELYGLDTPELDKREAQIKRDLDYLDQKKK